MVPNPRQLKIGRDITLEDHLNRTAIKHNNHGYEDFKQEIGRQLNVNGRVNNSEMCRFMNVKAALTMWKWRRLL